MPLILRQVPEAKLVIVGDGPAKADLLNQTKALHLTHQIIFTGEVNNEDVNQYYHMANVFVSTSNSESQGLTYIEAMATGLKVVVVRSAYTQDLLNHKSLGMTFRSEAEYVNEVVTYLKHGDRYRLLDNHLRQQKLREISSTNFEKKVVAFYRSCQLNFEKRISAAN